VVSLASALVQTSDRALLPGLWLGPVTMAWILEALARRPSVAAGRLRPGNLGLCGLPALLVAAGFCWHAWALGISARGHEACLAVSAALRQAGLGDPSQALSSGFAFYDLTTQRRYDTFLWDLPREPVDARDLWQMAREAGYRWLIVESVHGPAMFSWLQSVLVAPPVGVRVLFRGPGVVVFSLSSG